MAAPRGRFRVRREISSALCGVLAGTRHAAAGILVLGGALVACAPGGEGPQAAGSPGEVTVFAAASLAGALDEVIALYERASGTRVRRSYSASSILAKQIDAGAPADLFISANPAWMRWLRARGRLGPGVALDLLANRLVIVAPRGEGFEFDPRGERSLAEAFRGRLALGDPEHVPAGVYAREALEAAGWWEGIEDRVVAALDVRAALALVERAECGAGIVYATDVQASGRVEVVASIPAQWHEPIRYPVAMVAGRARPEVEGLLRAFVSPEAVAIFRAHGFRVPTGNLPSSRTEVPR